MSWDQIVESGIQEAMAAGAFHGLAGEGRPLPRRPEERLAGNDWVGFKVLQNGGLLPAWLVLAREIEVLGAKVEEIDGRQARTVEAASRGGRWAAVAPLLRDLRTDFVATARELRRKQDRFNLDAPALSLERPGIWIEGRLARLDGRVREAGCPEALLTAAGVSA
ncbi:MAG: DUF1992 domain-containing protein [Dehalococcoidia bacterium]|nr:DUF1992 domain-containing protein [Dehalococcoidia bacterium]